MEIRAILWKYYTPKSKKYPIKIRVTKLAANGKNSDSDYYKIGVKVFDHQWDDAAGKVVDHANAVLINAKIGDMINRVQKNFLQSGEASIADKENFYWWFDQVIKRSEIEHGGYNYEHLKSVKRKLEAYRATLTVSQVTYTFLKDWRTHLLEHGYKGKENSHNTVTDNLVRVRIIMEEIEKDGYILPHQNPFKKMELGTEKSKKLRPLLENFLKLETLEIPETSKGVRLAVDMALFSFYNGGTRWGDLCRHLIEMIDEEDRFRYTIHKTDVEMDIKLHPKAKEIAMRQKNLPYIFDSGVRWAKILDKADFPSVEEYKKAQRAEIRREDKHINVRNSFYNKKLAVACKWAGIPKFTYHRIRNLVADMAAKKKIPTSRLKDVYGHKKLSTTEIYQRDFYSAERDQTMEELYSGT